MISKQYHFKIYIMKEEKIIVPTSGYLMLLVFVILFLGGITAIVVLQNPWFGISVFLAIVTMFGFIMVQPNGSRVLLLFGKYVGTVKKNGFYWVNPFYTKKGISLRASNFDSERLKVNDKLGNPIMISTILVWRVQNTYKAAFDVDNYENFVRVQTDAAVRKLASMYPYDNFADEGHTEDITLRSSVNEVSEALEKEIDERSSFSLKGGETAALQRIEDYFWNSNAIACYKETRNELLGENYSSKFSAWLAQGCLSPKLIFCELQKYEAERTKNDSTYWMFFELMWRDFFRFMGKKHENKIFQKGGTKEEIDSSWENDEALLQLWIEGRTGVPFIDANMRELAATGFMSNRGRQNVASFLVKDLLDEFGDKIKLFRDPTRGGLGTVLHEIATDIELGVFIKEVHIPIEKQVAAACEMLGLDPMYVANEGVFIAIVDPSVENEVLALMRNHEKGKNASIIGEITDEHPNKVVLKSLIGGKRIVSPLVGEQLPRIC